MLAYSQANRGRGESDLGIYLEQVEQATGGTEASSY